MNNRRHGYLLSWLLVTCAMSTVTIAEEPTQQTRDAIKAYCIDFNWGEGGPNGFARPGLWADADPAQHVAWYKALGANVMQTFCVSCNGYAWYKHGVVPEQPGLKHDFLTEAVRLGHKEGLRVMGYFCIGSNTKWGLDHPDLSYGFPSSPHIPYTDEYLSYLAAAIRDCVRQTGVDGFMIDWIWQPDRSTTAGKWLDCEKRLYAQLMDQAFPGEDQLTAEQEVAYSRKALERCWSAIHTAAKDTNPACIIWLSSNNPTHPHVLNSRMYREVDWLMNEGGDMERVAAVKPMIGEHTRLITCLANWNNMDPTEIVPLALKAGIGLYGFTKPQADSLVPLEPCLTQPIRSLSGDARNIGALSRAYHGASLDSVRNAQGVFVASPQ
ncbi:MAG: alpha-amylase family protein [Pirellulaceae bacterium]